MFHVKHQLFADAKAAENLVQHVHLHSGSDDLSQCVDCILQLNGNQFHGATVVEFISNSQGGFQTVI